MKTDIRVPVIVRRPYRPEWGKRCCIYLIHYLKGWLYAGRLIEDEYQKLGYPYVGRGFVLEALGLKLQNHCTKRDLPFHASKIDYIEQWYCDPRFYSRLESWFIRRCASYYGISTYVLNHFEPNSFTESFVRSDGLLLNCHDNGFQQGITDFTFDARREGARSGGSNFTMSQLHQKALKAADTKKVNGTHPTYQSIAVEYPVAGAWVVKSGLKQICKYLKSLTGQHFCVSSLQQSLKRNHGDTWYNGIHFKYASLL